MSQIKTKKFGILFMIAMFAFILFGCGKESVSVDSVAFEFEEEQVVMYVGQTLELNEHIQIAPADATNQTYTLTSLDGSILSIEDSKIVALKSGSTFVKVVSNENETLQDIVKISVEEEQSDLNAPTKLTYNHLNQVLSFNPVENASSYTMQINDVEYELGNSTSFDLNSDKFDQSLYNNVLNVQVKANPSKYNYAYKSSLYAGVGERPLQIYQAAPVSDLKINAGNLTFQKNDVKSMTISLQTKSLYDLSEGEKTLLLSGENLTGGETLLTNYDQSSLSLNGLNASYMGKRLYAYVLSYVDDAKKEELGNKVNCYNSISCVSFDVLPNIDIAINDYLVSWTKLSNVAKYKLFIDGTEKAVVSTNKFDLSKLEDIEQYVKSENPYTLEIKPELTESNSGVVKADARFEVDFNRLENVEIRATENGITWTSAEKANTYYVYTSITGKTVPLKTNDFSLLAYPAGTYTLEVSAANLGGKVDGVYYIPSQAEDIIIEKKPQANIEINNYALAIKDTQDAERYLIEFVINDDTNYREIKTATSGELVLELNTYNFKAGLHEISVTKLGDVNNNIINSKVSKDWFTQLEAINAITVQDGKTIISRSEINARANFYLQIQSPALVEEKNIQLSALTYAYQTVNTSHKDHLPAGDYVVNLFVKGDGSETFSYMENGVEVSTAETEFTVLAAPEVTLNNHAVTKIEYTEIDGAEKYYVYNGESKVATKASTSYDFELEEGTTQFTVQAVGNGVTTLTSCLSDEIVIHRLETPTLIFDNENDKNSFDKKDDEAIKTEAIGGHSLLLNDVATGYAFDGSTFTEFEETNEFKLITIAKEEVVDGVYYINSNPRVLTIGKIENKATVALTKENVLTIKELSHNEEYNLQLVFTIKGTTKTFTGENGVLTDGNINIPYEYNQATKTYSLSMVNADYNEILDGSVEYGFNVKVRFIKPSLDEDFTRNSDYSLVQNKILNKIDATSILTINNSNKLIIEPTNQDKAYFLRLNLVQGATNITLNEVDGKLVGDGYELSFVKSGRVYAVNLLDANYNFLIDAINSNFTVSVAYSHNNNAGTTDTDSDYTTAKTVTFEERSVLSRNAQTVEFENVHEAYTTDYYLLRINGIKCRLYTLVPVGGKFVLDVDDLYSRYPTVFTAGVNEIRVITKNVSSAEADMRLSVLSEPFYCVREQVVDLNVNKDNNSTNNSLIIEASTFVTSYDKTYIFEILNKDKSKTNYYEGETQTRKDENAVSGKLVLNVDDYVVNNDKFGDKVYVSARVETAGSYISGTRTVYVFNSVDSTIFEYDIVSAATGIKISNNLLHFNEVAGAVGYEIYEKNGESYSATRLNSNLILSSPYELTEIVGQKEIVIKAVAQNGSSNSTYSNSITVIKLTSPTIEEKDGDFLVKYNSDVLDVFRARGSVTLVVNETLLSINLNSLPSYVKKVDDTSILISAEKLLKYNSQQITQEEFDFKLVVSASVGLSTYYLNSNMVESKAYGLQGPNGIRKISMEADGVSFVENMVWNTSSNNQLNNVDIAVKYEMMITYNNGRQEFPYSSTDVGLKYLDSDGTYKSYGEISEPKVLFPVGYDVEGDGNFEVKFEQGTYSVKIRAVPQLEIDGYNVYASDWSTSYQFKILKTPVMFTDNGDLMWDIVPGAEKYVVTLYQNGIPLLKNPAIVDKEDAFYKFNNKDLTQSGLIDVTIKAVSTDSNTINSSISEPYQVYRIPEASAMILEDGSLIFLAVEYFQTARIEFYNSATGTILYEHDNSENANSFVTELIEKGFGGIDPDRFTEQLPYMISGERLNIQAGYNYSVSVTLTGLSSEEFGVVSSAKVEKIGDVQPNKIIPVEFSMSQGVLSYNARKTTYDASKINYNYNSQTGLEDFWANTFIYRITMTYNDEVHTIYAVDYNKFMAVKDTAGCPQYTALSGLEDLCYVVKMGDVNFNVYYENKINVADYAKMHYYPSNLYNFEISEELVEVELDQGGPMFVYINMLGGDGYVEDNGVTSKTVGFITSNSRMVNPIVKYEINSLTSDSGLVQIENQIKYSANNDSEIIDYPVYRIKVSPVGNATQVQVVYLYTVDIDDDTKQEIIGKPHAEAVAQINDKDLYLADKILFVQAGGDTRNEDGYLTFDMSPYFEAGNYNVTVQALAGYGVDGLTGEFYWLNSRTTSEAKVYKKLTPTIFTANTGHLVLELSSVISDWSTDYSDEYEIMICEADGSNEYIFTINKNSEGVEMVGEDKFIYVMPSKINNEYELQENITYKIKAKAKSSIDYVLDGTYLQQGEVGDFVRDETKEDATFEFIKTSGIQSLEVVGGQLRWVIKDKLTYRQLVLNIEQDGMLVIARKEGTAVYDDDGNYLYHYHDLEGKYYIGNEHDNNKLETLLEAGDYKISAYVAGDDTLGLIDSNSIEAIRVTRLDKVVHSSIVSSDGVLTWDEVANAAGYEVIVTNTSTYKQYKYVVDTNSLAVEDVENDLGEVLAVGTYDIVIKTLGDDKLTSLATDIVAGFEKLTPVTNVRMIDYGKYIVWDEHATAQGYKVRFEYIKNGNPVIENITIKDSTDTQIEVPTNVDGTFVVKVNAIGVGETKIFNSDWVSLETNIGSPAPVGEIVFNEETYTYYWTVGDFFEGDQLVVEYTFERYLSTGVQPIENHQVLIDWTESKTYEFKLQEIGAYANFSVRVSRGGAGSSAEMKLTDEKIYNIYAYGAGTSTNPYVITHANHLLNIKHNPRAYFVLGGTINVAEVYNQTGFNNGALICDTFYGSIDGTENKFGIVFGENETTKTINLQNVTNISLFNKLAYDTINGKAAKIKNLAIGSDSLNVTINVTYTEDNVYDEVQLALIANENASAEIDNVDIKNIALEINSDSGVSLNGGFKIAGMFAVSTGGKINNSNVDIDITINSDFDDGIKTYVAAVVAYNGGDDTKATTLTYVGANFNLNVAVSREVHCVGGLVAKMTSLTQSTISNARYDSVSGKNVVREVRADITVKKATYIGIIVGDVNNTIISGCEAYGTVNYSNVTNEVYIGGILGYAYDTYIENSGVKVVLNVTTNNLTDQSIGVLLGSIVGSSGVSGCYAYYNALSDTKYSGQTFLYNGSLILGVYGTKQNSVTIPELVAKYKTN